MVQLAQLQRFIHGSVKGTTRGEGQEWGCRGWTTGQLLHLAGVVQLQRLPYNTVVVEQGTVADCTYFIKAGEVRVVKRLETQSPRWAAIHKDPLLGPKYAPTSQITRRSAFRITCFPCP